MSQSTDTTSARTELGAHLDVVVDEARMARGWEQIEGRAFGPPKRTWRPTALVVGGLAAAVTLCAIVLAAPWRAPGELRAVEGDPVALFEAAGARGDTVRFEDGSQVRLTAASRLESLENSGERFVVLLREGEARFEVEPGGPRRWIVEAGIATVEVVGTVFTVRREESGLTVAVERGRVLVRSERLPDRVTVLGRGETLHLDEPPEPELAMAAPSTEPAMATEPAVAAPGPEGAPGPRRPRVDEAPPPEAPSARTASPETATTRSRVAASVSETPSATGRADEGHAPTAGGQEAPAARLLVLADEARRVGDMPRALGLLHAASLRRGDPDAAVASFTRARLMLNAGRPAEAVVDLRRALRRGLPRVLEESARYQLVVALARSSDPVTAREAAAAYLRIYPNGAFRDEVRRDTP